MKNQGMELMDIDSSNDEQQRLIQENARLKRDLENIAKQLPHLRQLIEYSADAMVLHDDEGNVVDCNQRGAQMLGVARDQVYEQNLSHFLGNLIHIMLEHIAQLPTGTCEKFVGTLLRDDNTSTPVEIHITAFEAGGRRLHVSSMRDISDRLKNEHALREIQTRLAHTNVELCRVNDRMARMARMKDQFLANMSHELRTPLNAVLGLSEALMEEVYGPLTPKQRESLQTVQQSGQHLLELINDVLDLSKIEAERVELDIADVDVEGLCHQVLRLVKSQANTHRQRLHFSSNGSISTIKADAKRLKQILLNLLSNAVKFTPDGGEAGIELDLLPDENAVRLTVWDTGIGVPADKHELLFEPFVQLDGDLARQHAGTGLGLALVSRLTEMHGGRIELESATGRGSRFKVILPVGKPADITTHRQSAAAVNQPYAKTDTNETTATDEKATVLIIEDNPANINHVRDYLIARGFRVETAVSGLDGINKAWELLPDVVLMDIQMPGINGYEAVERLREDERTKDLHIIALTALAMPEDRLRCLNAGANDYLSKPYGLKALEAMINKTCCAGGAQEQ